MKVVDSNTSARTQLEQDDGSRLEPLVEVEQRAPTGRRREEGGGGNSGVILG